MATAPFRGRRAMRAWGYRPVPIAYSFFDNLYQTTVLARVFASTDR